MSTPNRRYPRKVSRGPLFPTIYENDLKNVVFVSNDGRLNQVRTNDIKRWLKKTGKNPEDLFNKTRYGEYFVGPLENLKFTLPERNIYNPTLDNSMRLLDTFKKKNHPYNIRKYLVKNQTLSTPEKRRQVLIRYPKENSNSYVPFSLVENNNINHPNKVQKKSKLQKLLKKMHSSSSKKSKNIRTVFKPLGKTRKKTQKRKSKKSAKKHSKK